LPGRLQLFTSFARRNLSHFFLLGSKQAAAINMRTAVSGSGGTVPSNKLAAGKPIAQTSMDSMHAPLAAHAEGAIGLEIMLAGALGAIEMETAGRR
jgi:hypothetical protein